MTVAEYNVGRFTRHQLLMQCVGLWRGLDVSGQFLEIHYFKDGSALKTWKDGNIETAMEQKKNAD